MYCNKCGAEVGAGQAFCAKCGAEMPKKKKFCRKCGAALPDNAKVCPQCGVSLNATASAKSGSAEEKKADNLAGKSKTTAILLAIFLGHWGAHNFYLGEAYKALIKIGLNLLSVGTVTTILVIIDIIRLATNDYKVDPKGFF